MEIKTILLGAVVIVVIAGGLYIWHENKMSKPDPKAKQSADELATLSDLKGKQDDITNSKKYTAALAKAKQDDANGNKDALNQLLAKVMNGDFGATIKATAVAAQK